MISNAKLKGRHYCEIEQTKTEMSLLRTILFLSVFQWGDTSLFAEETDKIGRGIEMQTFCDLNYGQGGINQ